MTSRTWKRAIPLVVALAVVASACGGRESGSSSSSTTAAATKAFINPADDCTDYQGTAGITGDTIKVGTIRPASGPYAVYDQVTTGLGAFFTAQNAAGGITAGDGKKYKVELVKEDDGYDPGRTPAVAKKLVEQDKVFALVGVIGTKNNEAIRDYMNEACVPNIALATGSPEWGKANEFPWYISALPSYATEAHAWVEYLKTAKPEAKIALLYQDDDFGLAYKNAIAKAVKGTKITVVGDQSFNPLSGGTTEAATTQLSQSGADTFIVGLGGTPCPKTLSFVPETWKPTTIISVTCGSKTALALAGGKDQGVLMAQATLDPADATDAQTPQVKEFFAQGATGGLDQAQMEGGIASVGWGFGALFAKGLAATKTVDRAGIQNALFEVQKDGTFGLVRPDVDVKTDNATDPWLIEGFRIVERSGTNWTEKAPMQNWNGKSNSFAGN